MRRSRDAEPPRRCELTYSEASTRVPELMALMAIAKPAPVPSTLIAYTLQERREAGRQEREGHHVAVPSQPRLRVGAPRRPARDPDASRGREAPQHDQRDRCRATPATSSGTA